MKRHLIAWLLILAAPTVAASDKWDKVDIALLATAAVVDTIDWGQTRYTARNPDRFYEQNPILGDHPKIGEVDKYFAVTMLGTALIADLLPGNYRKLYLGYCITYELVVLRGNFQAGVKLDF